MPSLSVTIYSLYYTQNGAPQTKMNMESVREWFSGSLKQFLKFKWVQNSSTTVPLMTGVPEMEPHTAIISHTAKKMPESRHRMPCSMVKFSNALW